MEKLYTNQFLIIRINSERIIIDNLLLFINNKFKKFIKKNKKINQIISLSKDEDIINYFCENLIDFNISKIYGLPIHKNIIDISNFVFLQINNINHKIYNYNEFEKYVNFKIFNYIKEQKDLYDPQKIGNYIGYNKLYFDEESNNKYWKKRFKFIEEHFNNSENAKKIFNTDIEQKLIFLYEKKLIQKNLIYEIINPYEYVLK